MTSQSSGANSGVVIIGGGIAGMATAYYLAKAGIRSTVIERDGLASHASGFAYGGLSGGIPNGPEPNQPVIRHSMALNDDEASALTQHLAWQQAQPGYQVTMLDHDQVLALEGRVNPDVVAGMHIQGGADVEPYRLTLALAEAAEKMGVVIRTGNVVGLHHHGSQVRGVALEGEEIPAETVVLAMGPWSDAATEWTGVNVPVRPLKGQIIRLQAPGKPYAFSIGHLKHYAMTKPADGFVWCGTTEEEAGFDESKTTESRDAIIESTLLMLPSLADADLALQTACLRPVTPDNVLMLGGMPGIDGLYIATGGGRQGIMMGPGMGQITADLIMGTDPGVDLAVYDAGRFTS
jgi:glycine/D-amino acid oxidase-like deaminating enzyme